MASHGKKRHVKRLAKPKIIPIAPKAYTYLKKASPGPHAGKASMAVGTLLVEVLKVAQTAREARTLLRSGAVLIDGRAVRDMGFPVGLMDAVSVPSLDKHFVITIKKGRLAFLPVGKDQASMKLCKVVSKRTVHGGKAQVNLHDGRSLLADGIGKYSVNSTLKLSVPSQTVEGVLPFHKGATCLVYKGVHSGAVAKLEELFEREASRATDAKLVLSDGSAFNTRKDYLFVVDAAFAKAHETQ